MSGLSRAQLTRWIGRWMKARRVKRKPARRPRFPRRYTAADIALLAEVDAAHEDLSGPATRHLLRREGGGYGGPRVPRPGGLSAAPNFKPPEPHPQTQNPGRGAHNPA